jgi:hypothetical protein
MYDIYKGSKELYGEDDINVSKKNIIKEITKLIKNHTSFPSGLVGSIIEKSPLHKCVKSLESTHDMRQNVEYKKQ